MARTDMDYEYDDLDVGAKPRVIVKKKGGLLGKFIALFLGIIIGIVAGLGGLVGAGYYIATQIKIKDATNTITNLSGIEIPLSDYLSDEYAEMTLLGAFDGTLQTLTKIGEGTGTLNDLDKISPFVGNYIESEGGLVDLLVSYGIDTTADELMSKYLVKTVVTEDYDEKYLSDYLMLKLDEIPFAKFVQTLGFEGNELITTLTYGVEGVDYKIENGEYVMLGDSAALTVGGFMGAELDNRIEKLPLDAVMGEPKDEIMSTLFYGAAHRYTRTSSGVVMKQLFYTYDGTSFYDDNGDKLSLTSAVAVAEQEDVYLLTLKNGAKQIVKLGADGKYYAFTADETPQIIQFPKTTIGDLDGEAEDLINEVTLEAALNVNESSHAVLKAIAYDGETKRTIKDLREKGDDLINGIKLSEIITADTDDTIVMYLLYGKKNVHYTLDPTTEEIIPLQKRVALYNGKVFNEYGELIEGATANGTESYTKDGVTYDLTADAGLGTIFVKVVNGSETTKHEATLYYVEQDGEKLYYQPTTLGDMQNAEMLSNLTGRLRLQDVMDVGENKILKHLAEEPIDDLPTAIDSLSLDDVFSEHFHYRTTKGAFRINENYQPIDNSGKVVENAKFLDVKNNELTVFDDEGAIIRSELDKALTGSWKYMLMERKEDGTFEIDHHHTVTELDSMMDYLANNVHDASVRELHLDGMVTGLSNETLNTVIVGTIDTVEIQSGIPTIVPKEVKIKYNDEMVRVDLLDGKADDIDYVGDLNVEQLMLYMSAMLDLMSVASASS